MVLESTTQFVVCYCPQSQRYHLTRFALCTHKMTTIKLYGTDEVSYIPTLCFEAKNVQTNITQWWNTNLQDHVAFTKSTKFGRRLRCDLSDKDSSPIATWYTNANPTFLTKRHITRFWPDHSNTFADYNMLNKFYKMSAPINSLEDQCTEQSARCKQ